MTRKEAAGVIKFEKACVLRQDTPRCNRDCKKCDLLLPTEDVLTAYDMAIKALEQKPCEDTISRQAAIDLLKQMRKDGDMIPWEGKDVFARIRKLPSAQPDIIRCRNCKFASGDSRICMKFGHSPIGELDFCAWAERRGKQDG